MTLEFLESINFWNDELTNLGSQELLIWIYDFMNCHLMNLWVHEFVYLQFKELINL